MSVDLNKYQLRTDLALDLLDNVPYKEVDNIRITDINVDSNLSKKINKKEGRYITIEFKDITDFNNSKKVKQIFSKYLKKLLIGDNFLVVGLGNNDITPDSLGPKTLDHILITNHIYELNSLENGFKRVSAIKPSVMGNTGIDSINVIKGVIEYLKPSQVIVIDSLLSSSLDRLNKTIQITNTGINPGSGVYNNRKELSFESLGVPVLAIGVPTVVDSSTIVTDTINYICMKYSYDKENINNPINRLVVNKNYLGNNMNMEDRKKLLGLIGNLDEEEMKSLVNEVLNPIGYNLIVTPKEIDFLIKKLSDIIGNGINRSIHKKVTQI